MALDSGHYRFQPLSPGIQGGALFGVVAVAVVDGGNTGLCVIEDFGDHQPGNARPGHKAGGGSP